MYGVYDYGQLLFGTDPGSVDPPDVVPPDLMRYLPDYYASSRVMRSLQMSVAEELGMLGFALDEILRQFFVGSATWGLDLWETELGLATDAGKPAERRREQLLAKLRGSGTTTRQMIIDTAASFSGGEVDVIEVPDESRFIVRFIGVRGIPPNMPAFLRMLDDIKPAHLDYSIAYTYTTWDNLVGLTWNGVSTKTWSELRVYEE